MLFVTCRSSSMIAAILFSVLVISLLICVSSAPGTRNETHSLLSGDQLFLHVYSSVFSLRDGSQLDDTDTRALDTLRASVQRLLDVDGDADVLSVARAARDEALLRILFLAVAGEFTVSRSPSALPQRCALVVDASSGALVLKDSATTQSVILEVLLIVSIACLMRAWGEQRRGG